MLKSHINAVKQNRKKTTACFIVCVLLVWWMIVVNTRLNSNLRNTEENITIANSKIMLRRYKEYARLLRNKICIFQMSIIVVIFMMCISLYKYIMTH